MTPNVFPSSGGVWSRRWRRQARTSSGPPPEQGRGSRRLGRRAGADFRSRPRPADRRRDLFRRPATTTHWRRGTLPPNGSRRRPRPTPTSSSSVREIRRFSMPRAAVWGCRPRAGMSARRFAAPCRRCPSLSKPPGSLSTPSAFSSSLSCTDPRSPIGSAGISQTCCGTSRGRAACDGGARGTRSWRGFATICPKTAWTRPSVSGRSGSP